ncbi:MAG: hypothetical protein R2867_15200 [Caldilineaceae bacterium]
MRRYGFAAVEKSREQMNGNDAIHKPLIGDLLLHHACGDEGCRTATCETAHGRGDVCRAEHA